MWLSKWAIAFLLLLPAPFESSAQVKPSLKNLPEVKFSKVRIELVDQSRKKTIKKNLHVELASTPTQHARGLMYRSSLGADEGMLFVFSEEAIRNFWMKNTYVALDIAYFDRNKTIIDIQTMSPENMLLAGEPPSYPSKKPAQYALEMPQGWFARNKISVGARLRIF